MVLIHMASRDTCLKYVEDGVEGHDLGYMMLYKYRATYLNDISKRLAKENEGFDFTDEEIYSMQEMCGFETTVRGNSQWCDVFTKEEWLAFEYARDVIHYYRAGPGNKYARSMGWLWLNATANLIAEGPESAGPLYFSLYVTSRPDGKTHELLLTVTSVFMTVTLSPCSHPSVCSKTPNISLLTRSLKIENGKHLK